MRSDAGIGYVVNRDCRDVNNGKVGVATGLSADRYEGQKGRTYI